MCGNFKSNHEIMVNLNSYSEKGRQIGIFKNLSDFSKQVGTSNKFNSSSKRVLILGFLIQIMFQI
jgi:hypothetical protein